MSAIRLRVLVTAASKHGSTHEIAEAIAHRLPEAAAPGTAITTSWAPVERAPDPTGYDAVVLGSAVYAGRWREEARSFATTHASVLRRHPVWLFSSGPIGQPPFPPDEPHDAAPLAQLCGARGHRVFPGRLDRALLSFPERAMVTAMRAPLGDFRDWPAVRGWADEIATVLTAPAGAAARPVPAGG